MSTIESSRLIIKHNNNKWRKTIGRSNPNKYVPNPSTKTIEWDAKKGKFKWYNVDKGENVIFDLPFRFAWVEELNTVGGYHSKYKIGIYGTEVKSTKTDELQAYMYVKRGDESEKEILAEGLWADIKGNLSSIGGKFGKTVYAVADGDNGPVKSGDIIKIQMFGCSMSSWFDKGFYPDSGGICVESTVEKMLDDKPYLEPVYKQEQISSDLDAIATKADKRVQAWYDQDSSEEPDESPEEPPQNPVDDDDDVPF